MTPILVATNFDIASKVADEIIQAANGLEGPRREVIDETSVAVRSTVFAPSLQGKSPKALEDGGLSFEMKIAMTKKPVYCAADDCRRSVPVLGTNHFHLIVEDGIYTGEVIVWERSCDYAH